MEKGAAMKACVMCDGEYVPVVGDQRNRVMCPKCIKEHDARQRAGIPPAEFGGSSEAR
jgi:hypothetical protein